MGTKGAHDSKTRLSSPFQYLIRYPLRVGNQWLQPSSEFELLNGNTKLPVELHADMASTKESVIVPAGNFTGCLKISISGDTKAADRDSHFQFHIEKDLWYAPGVGLIKSIQKEEGIGSGADAAGNSTNGTFSIVMLLENFRIEKPASSSGREK